MERIVVLASGSPRRRELLGKIVEDFQVIVSECDESISDEFTSSQAVVELSDRKALSVARLFADQDKNAEGIVIGSDTVVSLNRKILGKPVDRNEAEKMICNLSGRTHQVYTGVTVYIVDKSVIKKHVSFYEETSVHVHSMSEKEIKAYVASGEGDDKAGAYGIQGLFSKFIDGITGDYFNVVGLPVARLYQEIKDLII